MPVYYWACCLVSPSVLDDDDGSQGRRRSERTDTVQRPTTDDDCWVVLLPSGWCRLLLSGAAANWVYLVPVLLPRGAVLVPVPTTQGVDTNTVVNAQNDD